MWIGEKIADVSVGEKIVLIDIFNTGCLNTST